MAEPLEICIVTADIVGPIRNGGIGTAYASLARVLTRAGHRVTVLYTLGRYCEQGTIEDWQMAYAHEGITLVAMMPANVQGHAALKMAAGAYAWIKSKRFDVVHYHEWRGVGAYLAQAKRQGLCLEHATLVAGVHSPSLWHLEGMRETATPEDLEVDFLERQSVALADELWSPSRYMVTWLERERWQLPKRRIIRPNVTVDAPSSPASHRPTTSHQAPELVFFGRLETRKGLDLFCDAVDRVLATGAVPSGITFLGKTASVDGQPSLDFIRARADRWPCAPRIETTLDRSAAMAYLAGGNRLAVLPSRLDNSPYTVLECLAAGIPFIASNIGGIPELIDRRDLSRTLFDLTAQALADRLGAVLAKGQAPVRPHLAFDAVINQWLAWHADVGHAHTRARSRRRTQPLVSICMTTRNRPALLAAAIDSVRRQDYAPVELVLVDDGSDRPEALAYLDAVEPEFTSRGWTIVRQTNRYLGAARNRALASARGAFVLFMDDDNLAEPHEVSTFVRAAQTSGADILTCFLGVFQSAEPTPPADAPAHTWPFLGAAVGPGVLRNVFGDANAFIRRSVFDRIGGFTEDVGVGCEDWEFFARAVLSGLRLEVVPEPLVRYRQSPSGMLHTTSKPANHLRALRPYTSLLSDQARTLVPIAAHVAHASATPTAAPLDSVRTAVVFGSGDAGRRAIALARTCGWDVGWIVDNNPGMWNHTAHELPVKSPASLSSGGFDLVIVASLAGKVTIAKQLTELGLTAGRQFVHFLDPVRVGGLTHQVALS